MNAQLVTRHSTQLHTHTHRNTEKHTDTQMEKEEVPNARAPSEISSICQEATKNRNRVFCYTVQSPHHMAAVAASDEPNEYKATDVEV